MSRRARGVWSKNKPVSITGRVLTQVLQVPRLDRLITRPAWLVRVNGTPHYRWISCVGKHVELLARLRQAVRVAGLWRLLTGQATLQRVTGIDMMARIENTDYIGLIIHTEHGEVIFPADTLEEWRKYISIEVK